MFQYGTQRRRAFPCALDTPGMFRSLLPVNFRLMSSSTGSSVDLDPGGLDASGLTEGGDTSVVSVHLCCL